MEQSNPHESWPRESSEQGWTTTRCHRLLRPLKTHIAALRKELSLEKAEKAGNASDDGSVHNATKTTTASNKVQHTYSKRGKRTPPSSQASQQSSSTVPTITRNPRRKAAHPGEFVLPTPIVRRVRGQQFASPVQQPLLIEDGVEDIQVRGRKTYFKMRPLYGLFNDEMTELRKRVSSAQFSSYDSILRALNALLQATMERSKVPKSKSLMSMCLRKIPEYISELEYWEQRDVVEQGTKSTLQNSEISAQVYGELEAMGSIENGGWKHLRAVVRANGTMIIKDAIFEGLLDTGFAVVLVKLCLKTKSFLEGEELLEILVDRQYPKPRGANSTFDESRQLAPLKTLRYFTQESGRSNFMLRQISKLTSNQQLPLDWLWTKEFAALSISMAKSLSGGGVCNDAIIFAICSITSLCRTMSTKTLPFCPRPRSDNDKTSLQQTLISVITSIATMPVLGQEASAQSMDTTNQKRLSAISRRVEYIIQSCIQETEGTKKRSWASTLLQIAASLTSNPRGKGVRDSAEPIEATIVWGDKRNKDDKQHYEATMALVCSIAHCCGRGTSQPPHQYLLKLCDRLDQRLQSVELARKFKTDCAFFLAERNDLRDLAFAETLDVARAKDIIQPNPLKHKPAFRWEEGISEWVTVSPAPRRLSPSPQLVGSDDDEGHGSIAEPRRPIRDDVCTTDRTAGTKLIQAGRPHGLRTRDATGRVSHSIGAAVVRGERPLRKRKLAVQAHGPGLEVSDENVFRGEEEEDHLENAKVLQAGIKRRRIKTAINARPPLRSLTNEAHDDISDDELGM